MTCCTIVFLTKFIVHVFTEDTCIVMYAKITKHHHNIVLNYTQWHTFLHVCCCRQVFYDPTLGRNLKSYCTLLPDFKILVVGCWIVIVIDLFLVQTYMSVVQLDLPEKNVLFFSKSWIIVIFLLQALTYNTWKDKWLNLVPVSELNVGLLKTSEKSTVLKKIYFYPSCICVAFFQISSINVVCLCNFEMLGMGSAPLIVHFLRSLA